MTTHKIIEAADTMGFAPEKLSMDTIALTVQWPDGTESVELVSENAARVLGYKRPDEDAA